jgi:hypothetical protein
MENREASQVIHSKIAPKEQSSAPSSHLPASNSQSANRNTISNIAAMMPVTPTPISDKNIISGTLERSRTVIPQPPANQPRSLSTNEHTVHFQMWGSAIHLAPHTPGPWPHRTCRACQVLPDRDLWLHEVKHEARSRRLDGKRVSEPSSLFAAAQQSKLHLSLERGAESGQPKRAVPARLKPGKEKPALRQGRAALVDRWSNCPNAQTLPGCLCLRPLDSNSQTSKKLDLVREVSGAVRQKNEMFGC